MKKSLLTIALAIITLTSCQKSQNKMNSYSNNNGKIVSMEKVKNNKKGNKIKKKEVSTDIFKNLEGKKLYFSSGSMLESIYFYENGKFDGAYKKGVEASIDMGLFNGKFKLGKKLSDTSYELLLEDINYITPLNTDKTKLINDRDWLIHYGLSQIFNDNTINKEFILYLPNSPYSDFNDEEKSYIDMAALNENKTNKTYIEKYALKKKDDQSILLVEFKSKNENLKQTDKNYYEDLLLDNPSMFIDKSQFEYYEIDPKDFGLNL